MTLKALSSRTSTITGSAIVVMQPHGPLRMPRAPIRLKACARVQIRLMLRVSIGLGTEMAAVADYMLGDPLDPDAPLTTPPRHQGPFAYFPLPWQRS